MVKFQIFKFVADDLLSTIAVTTPELTRNTMHVNNHHDLELTNNSL